jgi:hypothetical protein
MAATWRDVAELVSERVGSIPAEEIQRHASEGPRGFYVALRWRILRGQRR